MRSSINQNLTEIVELHEEILGDLHRVVPHSEYTQSDFASQGDKSRMGHKRWRSLGVLHDKKDGMLWVKDVPGMIAEPQIAAEVAKIFSKKVRRTRHYSVPHP